MGNFKLLRIAALINAIGETCAFYKWLFYWEENQKCGKNEERLSVLRFSKASFLSIPTVVLWEDDY